MLGNNWLTFLCQSFVLAATVSAIGVRPAADMAAAVKKLGLRSAVQANEHSAVETGAPDSNRYGLDEDTYAWMRQGINALRKQAASKMKKQLTDEYLNSLPLTLGDIMLTPDQLHNALRRLGINVPQRQKRNTINFNNYPEYKWSFPIKYVIDPVLEAASEYVTLILDSLAEWERQTCVLFERHDVSENLTEQHLLFTNESYGCFAYVGRIPETELIVPQVVNLETPGCFGLWGVIIHEIGHALGLWHQQSRPDRDTYVKILYENIIPETIHNFDKETTDTASTYSVPYDYGSVMHYGPTDFATQDGLYTIEPIDVTQITAMGQASGLSFYDHMVINAAYCDAVCPTKLSCQNGGYTNPKNCQACRCPDGWGGTLCDQVHQGSTGCTPVSSVINVHSNVTNATQYLQSPNFINPDPQYPYNGPYAMGSSCSWILQVPTNCVINFWFEWVGMLYLSTGTCAHWVEVQYKTSHVTRGQRFCGYRSFEYTQQNPLTSDSNRVSVIFSAPIIETLQQLGGEYFQGFHMFYEQGVCSPVIGNNQAWKTQSSAVSVLLATVSIVYALVR